MKIQRRVQLRWCCLLAIGLIGAMLNGCGGSDGVTLAPVSGTVTYKGAPLAEAQVTFVPEKGPVAMGMTDLEGKFTLKTGSMPGAAVGNSKASVTASAGGDGGPLSKPMTPEEMQQMQIEGKLEAAMQEQNKSMIPDKYTRAEDSGLSFEVKKGEDNNFAIELQ